MDLSTTACRSRDVVRAVRSATTAAGQALQAEMAASSSSKSSSSPNASTLARHRSELTRNMLAGSCAISIAVGTFNPLDTLRVRWQVTPEGSGLVSYARQIVAREGLVKGLWTPGLGANMMSFFVCGGLRQGLYPWFRDTLVVA